MTVLECPGCGATVWENVAVPVHPQPVRDPDGRLVEGPHVYWLAAYRCARCAMLVPAPPQTVRIPEAMLHG